MTRAPSQVQYVELDKIVWPKQVRERHDDKDVVAMALSMKAVGQLYAILVVWAKDRWIGVDGATRWLAAKKLGWQTIAALPSDGELSEGNLVHRQLSANTVRTDLRPLEKARAVVRLMELTGWNASEAAPRLGMSNGAVTRLVSILSLPADIAQHVNNLIIPVSTAYQIAKLDDASKQAELAREVAAGRMTRDAASDFVKEAKGDVDTPRKREGSRAIMALGEGTSVTVKGESLSIDSVVSALEQLLGKLKKARHRGIELPNFVKMLKEQSQTRPVEV